MKTVLTITALLFATSASAAPMRADLFPMHGNVGECNDEIPQPACIEWPSDGSTPGRDEITAEQTTETWLDNVQGRASDHHHVIPIPRPMTGAELREHLRTEHNRSSRSIMGWTLPPEPTFLDRVAVWFEAGRRDGGNVENWHRHAWWYQRYAKAPGQDEDRGDAGAPEAGIAQDPAERPEPMGREHYDHRTTPPTPIDPVTGRFSK